MGWRDRFAGVFAQRSQLDRWASDLTEAVQRDDDDFWYSELGRKSKAGIRVTPDIALRASAVYACIKVLAETMASLPLSIYRVLPSGDREEFNSHPIAELIRYQPNGIQTAVEFWETTVLHSALRGVGYAEIKPGTRGAVDQLISLHADRVTTEVIRDGTLRFKITDPFTGATRTLLQEEMFRIPGLSSDGITGLRAVDIAADAIGLGMAADNYASRIFSNNLNMGGFLSSQKKMSVEAQKRLITKLVEMFAGGNNVGRPMILQDGIKYEKASMLASEAQLLEARKWQLLEMARFWRIPPHMLGIDDTTNRSTVEEQSLNFVKYTIRPWGRRIVQAIRRDLIIAKGVYEAAFDYDDLEMGNLQARADYFTKALGSGGSPPWLTQNEVRQREGWNRRHEMWADVLPQGTNPGGAAAGSNQPAAIGSPAPTAATEDNTPEARARRLAGKENKAFRKALLRHAADPDAMRDWIKAFYGGHVSCVMETLGIPKDAARAYCDFQKREAIEANDWHALVDGREEKLAATIAAVLKQHEVEHGNDAPVQA
ncbi:phage portal protein [Bradyrhizobium sp. 174]|uniref:phage portal protein n=1 Tax=Bradyrhizobium sp. 174 TaxID=2782645 RepID=UPI001FFA486E|nr:phage portal protein [Bradyrhizobium sp. 174]MCK1577811.1 phage portal protein [Bradyrhizobium sp. 174]